MLDVIALAVIGFGFLTAYFTAKTAAGKNACIVVLLVTVGLACVSINERLGLTGGPRLSALAPPIESREAFALRIAAVAERMRDLCERAPESLTCLQPDELMAATAQ